MIPRATCSYSTQQERGLHFGRTQRRSIQTPLRSISPHPISPAFENQYSCRLPCRHSGSTLRLSAAVRCWACLEDCPGTANILWSRGGVRERSTLQAEV